MEYVTGVKPQNAAERQLVAACVAGETCKLGDGKRPEGPDPDRNIRADLLRFLILGGDEGCAVAHAGVRMVGAYVVGTLDLSFAVAKGATLLVNCHFASKVSALQTRFENLTLNGSALPGLFAQGAKIAGGVFLRKSPGADKTPFHATGAVSVAGAEIGGQLSCVGGRFENAEGEALNAEGARVSGDVFLSDGFHATGVVRLAGAEIGGQLACEGGKFESAKGYALQAQRLNVREGLFWRGVTVVSGAVGFAAAHVGDLVDDLASWPEGAAFSLTASAMTG